MTPKEIEDSFKIHQARIAQTDDRLDRLRIEQEERFKRIEDNLVVQGEILNRIDQRLDRVSERMEDLTAVAKLHTNQLAIMQSAMTSLFQRMDAFIQGLDRGNGDNPKGGLQ